MTSRSALEGLPERQALANTAAASLLSQDQSTGRAILFVSPEALFFLV